MNGTVKNARIAGLFYLLMALTGPLGLIIAPSKIMVAGDAAATVQNLLHFDGLFRWSIFSNYLCQTAFVFLVLALVHLFEGINDKASKIIKALVIVAVPIAFAVELFNIAALISVSGAAYLKAFNVEQLNALTYFFLTMHEEGIIMVGLFWGLWLFPFGYLVIKSGFIPKILGILLMIGCLGYLLDVTAATVLPQFKATTQLLMGPLGIGEIATMLWLLIKGVKVQK